MRVPTIVVCCVLLCCYASTAVQSSQVHVKIVGDFRQPGLQGKICDLPDAINITITSGDVIISLEVFKSPRVSQDAPVYVIGDDGQVRHVTTIDSEAYALYQDLKTGAAILVTCPPPGRQTASVEGTVTYRGRQFHLRHSSRHRRDVSSVTSGSDEYQLTEVPEDPLKGQNIDYVPPPEFHRLQKLAGENQNSTERVRRQADRIQDVYIDIAAVIAFDIYQKFLDESVGATFEDRKADARQRIRKHYALIMTEVDLHYQMIGDRLPYKINLDLASFVIAETQAASPWTEQRKQSYYWGGRSTVDAGEVLSDFGEWITSSSSLPEMDYYVVFTGYDLESLWSTSTIGQVSVIGGVCASDETVTEAPGTNCAVVEDYSYFGESISTLVHELGHSLGAYHDGTNGNCLASDNYTMTPVLPGADAANFGLFSTCSLDYFTRTFALLATSPRSRACIYQSITPASVPNVTGLVPGQVYDVQTQCKRAFGDTSYVCANTSIGDTMCTNTFCRNPVGLEQCESIPLLRGTTCGNKKWCVNARCVPSADAGSMDESCPFGIENEYPSPYSSRTCSEFATEESWRCYDEIFRKMCCKSCNNVKRQNSGCPYGDRSSECQASSCNDPRLWETCCSACSAFITTRATTTTTSADTRTTASPTTPRVSTRATGNSYDIAGTRMPPFTVTIRLNSATSVFAACPTLCPLMATILALLCSFLLGH